MIRIITTPIQHQGLQGETWGKLSFFEQMAHVGSEVERALRWKQKKQTHLMQKAAFRAIELLSFTIDAHRNVKGRIRELSRVKECLQDTFYADNQYDSQDAQWKSYFRAFTYAASLRARR